MIDIGAGAGAKTPEPPRLMISVPFLGHKQQKEVSTPDLHTYSVTCSWAPEHTHAQSKCLKKKSLAHVNDSFRPGANEVGFPKEKVSGMFYGQQLALGSKGPGKAGHGPDLGIPHPGPF